MKFLFLFLLNLIKRFTKINIDIITCKLALVNIF